MLRYLLASLPQFQRGAGSAHSAAGAAYGRVFWLSYLANASVMVALSLLVRYADFVALLGGDETWLGWIVGAGTVGSLTMRLWQGSGIDRYGPRIIWLGSLALLIATLLAHLAISSLGPAVFVVRMLMTTAVAGIFGSSIAFISRRVPPDRMPEMIGTLGTSGFVGSFIGPQLGDWICRSPVPTRSQLHRVFLTAAAFAAVALAAAAAATWKSRRVNRRRQRRVPAWKLVRRYHPGLLLVGGVVVGLAIAIPSTFLRSFAIHLGIQQIGVFFAAYAVAAIVVRLAIRNMFGRFGTHRMAQVGMLLMAISFLLYLPVQQAWQFMFPGLLGGVAHAFLFPAIVGGGSIAFPERYRGLGTTLMLATFDIGNLLGAPLAGSVVSAARVFGWPEYLCLFSGLALLMLTGCWLLRGGKRRHRRLRSGPLVAARKAKDAESKTAGTEPAIAGNSSAA